VIDKRRRHIDKKKPHTRTQTSRWSVMPRIWFLFIYSCCSLDEAFQAWRTVVLMMRPAQVNVSALVYLSRYVPLQSL